MWEIDTLSDFCLTQQGTEVDQQREIETSEVPKPQNAHEKESAPQQARKVQLSNKFN